MKMKISFVSSVFDLLDSKWIKHQIHRLGFRILGLGCFFFCFIEDTILSIENKTMFKNGGET